MAKEIEQKSPFELEDEQQSVDTDVEEDKTLHNVSQEIVDRRNARKQLEAYDQAWERKRQMQEEEAQAIEDLQKALEDDSINETLESPDFYGDRALSEKELLEPKPKRNKEERTHGTTSLIRLIKEYLPFFKKK